MLSWAARIVGGMIAFDAAVVCAVFLRVSGKKDSKQAKAPPEPKKVPMPEHWATVYIQGED